MFVLTVLVCVNVYTLASLVCVCVDAFIRAIFVARDFRSRHITLQIGANRIHKKKRACLSFDEFACVYVGF